MPTSHAVKVALKFASNLRRNALSERITTSGQKLQQNELEGQESEEDEDFETMGKTVYISNSRRMGNSAAMAIESQELFVDEDSNSNDANPTAGARRRTFGEGKGTQVEGRCGICLDHTHTRSRCKLYFSLLYWASVRLD